MVGAVECALALQQLAAERNATVAAERRMEWRIGVHLGDVLIEGDDILGDGVNIAARLEGIAEPNWICIFEDAFRQVRGKVEVEFADLGEQSLKNIARPLRVYRVGPSSAARQPMSPAAALPLPDKPSIAVLPFQNMSGDPEQEYLTDGMVEDIIIALSRIRWLFVIARYSSFMYRGQAIDVKQVGRELGVRYVLEGSVRRAGSRVRITAQLIEAFTGAHLWADRFDGSLEDVFELQDKVAINVAGVIEPTLQAAEIRRSAEQPTNDLTAYDLYLRALALAFSWEKDAIIRARDLLEQAIERDPRYALALALAARINVDLHVSGWTDIPETNRRNGIDLARRALGVAGGEPEVLAYAAYVLAYFREDIYGAIELVERALELNPSFARGWQQSAWLRLWAGDPDPAIKHFETSWRLSPREHRSAPFMGIGVGHFFAQRFEDARKMLLLSLQEKPNWVPTHRFLAACYAHLGRFDEAHEAVTRLRALTNELVPSATNWRNPEHREFYLSGLRLATGEPT